MRQPDTIGVLGLALNTCSERDGHPETTDRIAELIETAGVLWSRLPDTTHDGDRFMLYRTAGRLLQIADVESVTGG